MDEALFVRKPVSGTSSYRDWTRSGQNCLRFGMHIRRGFHAVFMGQTCGEDMRSKHFHPETMESPNSSLLHCGNSRQTGRGDPGRELAGKGFASLDRSYDGGVLNRFDLP
jgi:hypothetical protein